MKRFELVFNIIAIFVDAIMLAVAGSLAYFLRFRVENLFPQYPIIFHLSYSDFLRNVFFAIPVILLLFAISGLYNLRSTQGFGQIFVKVAIAISSGLMLFVAVYFFNQEVFPSRLIVLMSWLFAIILVSLGRLILLLIERGFLKRGIGLHRLVLIMGWNKDFELKNEIKTHPEYGYKIIKTLDGSGDIIGQLEEIRKTQGIDEILQANLDLSRDVNLKILKFTHDYGIKFNYIPDIVEAQRANISAGNIAGLPVIELHNTPLDGWGKVVKRILDIIVSLLAIIILSPLFLFVALGVKLTSPGKILFVQERFGQGKPFRFYKFRSMYQELSIGEEYGGQKAYEVRKKLWEENARKGPFLKIKNDPRVTPFGRFIRKTKLDELPQLFSVLKGDMSLVGPRAHVLEEVNLYKETYKRQFTIKPGVTGLTQITQARIPDLPFEEEIRLDTYYLENWSLMLDLQILFQTFLILIRPPKGGKDYY